MIYCFNCGWSSKPLLWIEEVGGLTYKEIMQEVKLGEYNFINLDKVKKYDFPDISNNELPEDSINLFNSLQLEYYKSNAIVFKALKYLNSRRLLTAINRPDAFYLSLSDSIHRNRIIIPFQDIDGTIPFYQSRAFGGNIDGFHEDIRYLSKKQSSRTVFGINKITNDIPYIFLFEGPIDACFVKNGVAVAGINLSKGKDLTQDQEEQLARYKFTHKFIWVLDSQFLDETAKEKTELLLKSGESVFIWPKVLGMDYKDFNECCVAKELDEIPYQFIEKNSVSGKEGLLKYRLKILEQR